MNVRLLLGAVAVAATAILTNAAWENTALNVSAVVIGIVLVLGPHVYLANRRPR